MKASSSEPEVRTITAAEFKAKCLQLMDEVNEKKLTLIVTKRGKPVLQATAPRAEKKKSSSFIGATRGSITAHGDIVSALPNVWAALEE